MQIDAGDSEQETLTMYKHRHISASEVGKFGSVDESPRNEGSNIKSVQSGGHGRCHSEKTRLMADGEPNRIGATETKIVLVRSDQFRTLYPQCHRQYWHTPWLVDKDISFVLSLREINVGMSGHICIWGKKLEMDKT